MRSSSSSTRSRVQCDGHGAGSSGIRVDSSPLCEEAHAILGLVDGREWCVATAPSDCSTSRAAARPDIREDGIGSGRYGTEAAPRDRVQQLLCGTPHHPSLCELRDPRSEEHTSELQSLAYLVCRLLLEKKKKVQMHRSY